LKRWEECIQGVLQMELKKTSRPWVTAIFGVLLIAVASAAHAAFILELEDLGVGGSTTTIPDQSVLDMHPGVGVIVFNGAVGGFIVNVTTGISKPMLPATPGKMDLNSIDVSGAAGILEVRLTDTDFPILVAPGMSVATGGTTDGTVSLTAIFDPGNNLFGAGGSTTTISLGPFGPGAFAAQTAQPLGTIGAPFSLTEIAKITHTSAALVTSFDAELNMVPEPGSVAAMAGIVLSGFVGYVWRRRKQAA
jgi:hypothetical protein